jgi:hypothetical protein
MAKVASSFLDLPAWLKTGVVQLGLPGASLFFFQLRFFFVCRPIAGRCVNPCVVGSTCFEEFNQVM